MPEKQKSVIVKSKSVQGFHNPQEVEYGPNIFERQVDSISPANCDRKDGEKSSTLPNKIRTGVFVRNQKNNSLKRSITLPRNPFVSIKKGKKYKVRQGDMAGCEESDKENIIDESSVESEPTKSSRRMVKTDSVKSFFTKVVNQISSNSRSRTKFDSWELEGRTQEWRSYFEGGCKVPGVIGIRNHGNTCFINSILQCLSYTDILAEYFVLDQYKSDLKRRKRLCAFAKSTGTGKGEVTEQLATLLKSLWSLQYDPEISDKFKSLVDKYGSQYKGGNQHDAQEFLLWLLDRVHEELNTATKKKYKRLKNLPGRPDDVLAAESLANYMRCNNSFVVDIFQAQFRSSLTCPACERQSNTFDPFLCVSLPIPQKQFRPILVTVLYIDQSPRQVRIGLTLPVDTDIKELREVLSRDTGIDTPLLLLVEIDSLGFQNTFSDTQSLSAVKPDCPLFAIESPKRQDPKEEEDGAFMVLTWVNVFKEGDQIEKRFGTPYTIQVSRETIYGDLQKLLMKEMSPILHDDILISAQKVPLFKIRVLDGFDGKTYMDDTVEMPLYMECVETAMNMWHVGVTGGPAHIQLVLEWDMPAKTQIIADDSNPVEEHSSCKQVLEAPDENSSVSLQECFSLYTSEERLGKDDAFFCPQCNKKREVVKKLGVWSVPDVLVVHLKRFRQSTRSTNKLETMVDFPMDGFDMSPNMARGSDSPPSSEPTTNSNGLRVLSAFSPWKHPKRFRMSGRDPEETTYELYSVCNHHGSDLQGGHYTAVCRNPTDGQWYSFDDIHTKQIPETEVVTKDAYILFYQKSCLSPSPSSSSSSSGSGQDHWVYRMPDFTYKTKSEMKCAPTAKPRATKKEAKKASTSTSKPGTPGTSQKFIRNSAKYATLPAKRTSKIIHLDTEHHSENEQGVGKEDSSDDDDDETVTATAAKTVKPDKKA